MASAAFNITNRTQQNATVRTISGLSKGISTNVLPMISQMFKDTLLFSGPEMEMMALFLTDHVRTATTAVKAAALLAADQFKPKPAPCSDGNTFGHMQPCI
ncbi:hypothetical protein [Mucilaginibacter myungsuensis]|uniref:Uncharacterized protein n=1 Tax=Mucilaginibacter myungsuensis TaxID=649104 RepID=A0A929KU50_9SPHI|nr:hypothetical protein [Mucilaginibacter myungsuensis]MBE9661227.1 hypothetical protein [Mucilaginibacter myungsuensis]MDN3597371.1 hypothetical protein [Mucilaginibacter myungsuensis]